MASSLLLLTRSRNNLLLSLTRRDRYFPFQSKRNWNSLTKAIPQFRLASSRTLNSNSSKDTILMNMSVIRRQTTSATNSPNPAENLPKKVRSKPKTSNVDPETKKAIRRLTFISVVSGICFIIYSGRPFKTDRENQYKDLDAFTAWYKRLEGRTKDLFHFFTEPPSDKLLPDQDSLPPPPSPYTLVINLDQTLIYSTWDRENGWRTAKRPGVDYFLFFVANFFEVVIFTSQPSYVAEPILVKLDPVGVAPYRLFRESTRYVEGKIVKDISKLNRDLSKVIIMDSNPNSYSLQPENAISVPPWKGDPNDTFLIDILPFLEYFVLFSVNDVRQVLPQYKEKNIPAAYAAWEEQWKEQQQLEWEKKLKQPKKGLASLVSAFSSGQIQEQVPPYKHSLMQRQMINDEINNLYRDYKRRAPEIQQMYESSMENLQKQMQESMKEKRTTIWELITQGPPQVTMPDSPPDQDSLQLNPLQQPYSRSP
ncbi:HAD-like domain-containing protein [Glomus cerebriforme]|uniref:Mitochondrial import inner membrane translocase subunit TIM50 n=1 Tax=Glomus cerebriforme TaxID=658196 RepID=A0A397T7D4_9GLOM|nr:HAD-like domain-containing protein [Glomus cerebriforme]